MATYGDLLSAAEQTGATVTRKKPAWQLLREQGIGGQGSAAANKAKLAEMQGGAATSSAPSAPGDYAQRSAPPPTGAPSYGEPAALLRSLRLGTPASMGEMAQAGKGPAAPPTDTGYGPEVMNAIRQLRGAPGMTKPNFGPPPAVEDPAPPARTLTNVAPEMPQPGDGPGGSPWGGLAGLRASMLKRRAAAGGGAGGPEPMNRMAPGY